MNHTDSRLEAAQSALEAGLKAMTEGSNWAEYLKMQARFHNYSLCNVLWLMGQAAVRGASVSRFAGYTTWQKMGRQVKQGEKSYQVLAPIFGKRRDKNGEMTDTISLCGFKVVPTFDLGQTEGQDLPEVLRRLEGTSEELQATFAKLAAHSASKGVPVSRAPMTGSQNGVFYRSESRIAVRDDVSDLQALKTLVHEMAHSMLHAKDTDSHEHETNEVEAESTAFIVLHALGLDTSAYSFGYVAHWSNGDLAVVKKVGDRVQRTAKALLSVLEEKAVEAEAVAA